jgi:hypothetical protein
MACRLEWTVFSRIDRTCGVRKAVRSWRPSWTPDTTARTSDGTGWRTFRHPASAQVVTTGGPDAGSGWLSKGASALPSGPVRARTCRPRGWSWPAAQRHGRTLGAGSVRRLGRRCPDRVQTHRLGDHLELGMSGRPDGREVRHVRRQASGGRVSAGGTGRRRRCPDGCPAVAPWPEVGGQPDCGRVRHATARSWRWPPGGPGLDAGRQAAPVRKPATPPIGLAEERGGGWVGGCQQAAPVRWAGGLVGGAARRRGSPRRG